MQFVRGGAVMAAGIAGLVFGLAVSAVQAEVVPPVVVDQPRAEMPRGPFGPGPEGWVKVRYSVTADGRTANVRAVDSQPPQLDTRVAVAAVEQWRFQPASDNGTPVEWHNNVSFVVFENPDAPRIPNPMFRGAFDETGQLIAGGRLDRAKSRNERMQRESTFRLFEMGVANMQLAEIEAALGNLAGAYASAVRATMPEVNMLDGEDLIYALDYRFLAAAEMGRVPDALDTFERRAAIQPYDAGSPIPEHARRLRDALPGVTLAVNGEITRDPWSFEPSRRTFTVEDVDGRVDDILIECNRRTATLPFQEDAEWSIPESWGDCLLTFNGRRGTTFTLYEFL